MYCTPTPSRLVSRPSPSDHHMKVQVVPSNKSQYSTDANRNDLSWKIRIVETARVERTRVQSGVHFDLILGEVADLQGFVICRGDHVLIFVQRLYMA